MAIPVFELTPLTRGAASERRVVVKTVEMNRQTFFTLLAGIAPAVAKSKTGKFYVRGEEFDPLASTWVDVIRR